MGGSSLACVVALFGVLFIPVCHGHFQLFPSEHVSAIERGVFPDERQMPDRRPQTFSSSPAPSDYQSRSAEFKQDYLWKRLQEGVYTNRTLPMTGPTAAELAKLLVPTFLMPVFTHTSDELPAGRKKFAHPFGTTAKIQLEIVPSSPYTGIFKSGGIGITRFSWATFDTSTILPGFAVKMLIDGRPSVQIMTAPPVSDQGSNRNFFLNPVSTIFIEPTAESAQKVNKAFEGCLALLPAFYNPQRPSIADRMENRGNNGLYEQASVTNKGKIEKAVVAPWKVDFIPNPALTKSQNGHDSDDFRAQLGVIPSGTMLYELMAYKTRDSKVGEKIGKLYLRSAFVASRYGDEGMHFQHAHKRWQPRMFSAWRGPRVPGSAAGNDSMESEESV